jgi:hypothetical protein
LGKLLADLEAQQQSITACILLVDKNRVLATPAVSEQARTIPGLLREAAAFLRKVSAARCSKGRMYGSRIAPVREEDLQGLEGHLRRLRDAEKELHLRILAVHVGLIDSTVDAEELDAINARVREVLGTDLALQQFVDTRGLFPSGMGPTCFALCESAANVHGL